MLFTAVNSPNPSAHQHWEGKTRRQSVPTILTETSWEWRPWRKHTEENVRILYSCVLYQRISSLCTIMLMLASPVTTDHDVLMNTKNARFWYFRVPHAGERIYKLLMLTQSVLLLGTKPFNSLKNLSFITQSKRIMAALYLPRSNKKKLFVECISETKNKWSQI